MSMPPLRYEPYEATVSTPNVVLDGSPNPATVLALTHWPGFPAPPGLAADLSAQMAFRYLDGGRSLHEPAQVVTNNHFDQDGLVSLYALVHPNDAQARRAMLEDLAAAGDFATYQDRRAARLSMAVAAYGDPSRSPLAPLPSDHGERCALLYRELLYRLPDLADRLDDHRDLWEDEDRDLTENEAALAGGDIVIEERPEVDLAVVTINDGVKAWSGHRFAARTFEGLHPMALHNATGRFALLLVRGRHYQFIHRYETWVQYRSRPTRPRVDLTGLAAQLSERESGGVEWHADPVSDPTPRMRPADDAESSLPAETVVAALVEHLRDAPPAWNPYVASPADS